MRRLVIAMLLTTAAAFAQSDHIIWQPPTLDLPDTLPHATVSKEIITKLRVAKMQVILEETPLNDVQKNLGGTIGSRGDASEALDGFAWQRIAEKAL